MSQPETFVVVNYGAARARAAWSRVAHVLTESNVRFDAHEAKGAGDAQSSTRAALQAGYRIIAAVGGDGTLSEVVSGFFEGERERNSLAPAPAQVNTKAALALLPAGTGNDFARGLAGGRASLEDWLARLVKHSRRDGDTKTRSVDVLHGIVGADGRPFFCLNAATLGIGAEVAGRVAAQGNLVRGLPGESRFALAALAALVRWRSRRISIRMDDEAAFECATNLVAIANSPFAGGGMMFSPDARVDDGRLDVVTACRLTRRSLVREMTRIHRGGHIANPRVRIHRGTRVRIEHLTPSDALAVEADGDVRGLTPLEFRVIPGALKIVF